MDGSPSTGAWLRARTGMRAGEARNLIETGRLCELLPATGGAWRAGEITTGAVRTITAARVPDHDDLLRAVEPQLLRLAREGADRDLARACAHFRDHATADGTEPRDHDGLSISKTYAGRAFIGADLSGDGAEIVVTAIHAFTDPPTDADPRSTARRRADALVEMARVALARRDGEQARPDCTVVIDWTTLTGRDTGCTGRLDGAFTGAFTTATVERLLCDCEITRVVTGPNGQPLDVGRASRTVRRHQRKALAVRDGGCRFPGCGRPVGWTEAHHVGHWTDGGRTDLDNLVLFCSFHHHLVHRPGWTVKFDGRDLHIARPDGTHLTDARAGP